MGLSEGALPGVGEECGPGVYPVCPGEFLPGQAGVGRTMRIDPAAAWDGTGKSLENDTKSRGRDRIIRA